ncbi:MAG: DUF1573 domain-containing protein [Flavobacteriia bacterium]|nr:DUF1573 domain-containing protein [Flavobacteriia bacterium]
MKKTVYIISSFLLITACIESKKEEGNSYSSIAAGGESEKELQENLKEFEKEESKRLKAEEANKTTLSFDKIVHDYGNVKPDSDNSTYFTITNTGKKPLIIENVEASCGCTTPEKPEHPILPGKSDRMKVSFHPKPGQMNEIEKKVTVTANTNPRLSILTIKAFVK